MGRNESFEMKSLFYYTSTLIACVAIIGARFEQVTYIDGSDPTSCDIIVRDVGFQQIVCTEVFHVR